MEFLLVFFAILVIGVLVGSVILLGTFYNPDTNPHPKHNRQQKKKPLKKLCDIPSSIEVSEMETINFELSTATDQEKNTEDSTYVILPPLSSFTYQKEVDI